MLQCPYGVSSQQKSYSYIGKIFYGSHLWVDGITPWSYENWNPDITPVDGECVQIYQPSACAEDPKCGTWSTVSCSTKMKYVCEYNASGE